jgi:hypothetical protein
MTKDEKKEEVNKAIEQVPDTPMVPQEPKEQVVENSPATEEIELTLKEELFCRNYASSREFFGNGTRSYMDAYQTEDAHSASVLATRLLAKVSICQRIAGLLTLQGWNDEFVDKQTLFLITQNADLKAKAAGLKIYNEVKKRVTQKMELTNPDGVAFMVEMVTVKPNAQTGDQSEMGEDSKAS